MTLLYKYCGEVRSVRIRPSREDGNMRALIDRLLDISARPSRRPGLTSRLSADVDHVHLRARDARCLAPEPFLIPGAPKPVPDPCEVSKGV